jgi:hypothetical protein
MLTFAVSYRRAVVAIAADGGRAGLAGLLVVVQVSVAAKNPVMKSPVPTPWHGCGAVAAPHGWAVFLVEFGAEPGRVI